MWVQVGSKMTKKAIFIPAASLPTQLSIKNEVLKSHSLLTRKIINPISRVVDSNSFKLNLFWGITNVNFAHVHIKQQSRVNLSKRKTAFTWKTTWLLVSSNSLLLIFKASQSFYWHLFSNRLLIYPSIKFETTCSLKIALHKFKKYKREKL